MNQTPLAADESPPPLQPDLQERIVVAVVGGAFGALFALVIVTGLLRREIGGQESWPAALSSGAFCGVACGGMTTGPAILFSSGFLTGPHPRRRWWLGIATGVVVGLVSMAFAQGMLQPDLSDYLIRVYGQDDRISLNHGKAILGGIVCGCSNGWIAATSIILLGRRAP